MLRGVGVAAFCARGAELPDRRCSLGKLSPPSRRSTEPAGRPEPGERASYAAGPNGPLSRIS